MRVKQLWQRFLREEEGQSTTEYILILSVVVMIALKFKTAFSERLSQAVTKLGGKIDEGLTD